MPPVPEKHNGLGTGPVPGPSITESPAPPHRMQPIPEQSRPSSAEPGPAMQRIMFRQPENLPGLRMRSLRFFSGRIRYEP
ncbi:MAG: hypothetical protein Q7J03_07345 [Methanoregula sp.]|nr:hypothetical protein [Methanoregula sp.]